MIMLFDFHGTLSTLFSASSRFKQVYQALCNVSRDLEAERTRLPRSCAFDDSP